MSAVVGGGGRGVDVYMMVSHGVNDWVHHRTSADRLLFSKANALKFILNFLPGAAAAAAVEHAARSLLTRHHHFPLPILDLKSPSSTPPHLHLPGLRRPACW